MSNEVLSVLIKIGIMLLVTLVLMQIVRKAFNAAQKRTNNISLRYLRSIIQGIIIIVSVYIALSMFEVTKDASTTILQSSTLIIAVLTFAAQSVLGNVISGFNVSITKPFSVGQKVRVESGGTVVSEGIIEDITLRHTIIRQFDGQMSIVPNSVMDSSVIINTNYTKFVGNFLEVEIGYDADMDLAKKIFVEIYREEPLAIKKDEVTIYVARMTANGVILKTTIWTETLSDNFLVCSNMRQKIVAEYRKNGITIPYNTITISPMK